MTGTYGVDPHTAVLIVGITLPGMFVAFVLVGTIIYLRRRARWRAHEKMRVKEQGAHVAGDYEKWLEHVLTPGTSRVPSQVPSRASSRKAAGKMAAPGPEVGNVSVREVEKEEGKSGRRDGRREAGRMETVVEVVE